VNPFAAKFCKFSRKGFLKTNFGPKSSTTCDFRPRYLRNDYKSRKLTTNWPAYGMMTFHFGRPFVKRLALCYRTVVLSACLSCRVCDIGILWPNGWMDEDETCHTDRLRQWPQCLRWGPTYSSQKGDADPNFRPMSVVAKWLHGLRYHLVWSIGLCPSDFVLDGDPVPLLKKGAEPPNF